MRDMRMGKRFKKHLNIMTTAVILASTLAMPFSVGATANVIKPQELSEEDIREEREASRAEGAKSGIKIEVELGQTTVANIFANGKLSQEQIVNIIGEVSKKDYQQSGILASVTAAQCILESGYLGTGLAVDANNCFGMKAMLSGNTWPGSTWTGETFSKQTWEEQGGMAITVIANFRKYASIEQSLADHSAYLLGAQKGSGPRYAGLQGELDYRRAIQIIKDGGYATDSRYVDKVCSIIEKFNLTQYDVIEAPKKPLELFRVRRSWENVASQLGAFANVENAKRACKAGYKVFDPDGKVIYEK